MVGRRVGGVFYSEKQEEARCPIVRAEDEHYLCATDGSWCRKGNLSQAPGDPISDSGVGGDLPWVIPGGSRSADKAEPAAVRLIGKREGGGPECRGRPVTV